MVYRKISRDLKDAAMRLWDLGWEEDEIMRGLVVSRSSLYRWKSLFQELGTTTRPPSPLVRRPRIITRAVLTACYDIYRKEPDLYLDELRWHLAIHHDIVISISALQKNLDDVGLTRKLLHKVARERDKQQRQDYLDAVLLRSYYGRTINAYEFNRRQGFSVGAAMSKDGYLAVKVVPGAFDSFDFFDFVAEQVLPQMNEWPQKHSVLVLDNCRIHHNDALLELLSANSVFSFHIRRFLRLTPGQSPYSSSYHRTPPT
ncbi:hypothetical protein C8F04DRAFT_952290 [Mycena alexandri]|uniref:Tc1-like transposase DDE domain-containing protein n=1 Tax=Mycena alexandri TaxID=1745969 RepID=A0AAD6T3G6_9AGAR|nr:hypothetical protein C8F04DRAFT_952290 [Mycena alexandri]